LRKCLKQFRNVVEYDLKLQELRDLLYLEQEGFINIYYGDESGFSLTPNVPYGWQPKGQYIGIPSQKSTTINVFGLLSRDNHLEAYTVNGSMDAACLATFIDDFAQTIEQPTVIILDNAPFHHAKLLQQKIEQWKLLDLRIWFLPTYSPHLNIIETLWRKIKYEWLKHYHYKDQNTLLNALEDIIRNVGTEYKIQFN
jgi:DDE superfamily endonuclease